MRPSSPVSPEQPPHEHHLLPCSRLTVPRRSTGRSTGCGEGRHDLDPWHPTLWQSQLCVADLVAQPSTSCVAVLQTSWTLGSRGA